MRKKLLAVLICVCMAAMLFACGKPQNTATPTNDPTPTPTKVPATPTPTQAAGEVLPDPVYHYTFDKSAGTTGIMPVKQEVGASPIVQNVPDKEIVFVDGVKGDAIYADGATAFKLTDVKGVGDKYSISFWVNPSRSARYMPTVQYGPDIHGDLTGGQHYVNFTWADWSGNMEYPCVWAYHQNGDEAVVWPNWFPESADTRVKVWSHIVLVVDPDNTTDEGSNLIAKVYLNGELIGEPTIVTETMSPSDNFEMLLGINYWDAVFKGAFDEFYVFNDTLTEGQVKTLFNEGNATATYKEPEHEFIFAKEPNAIESIGAENFVSEWMSTTTKARKIADGETWQVKLHNWSDGKDSKNNYAVVFANKAKGEEGYAEYAVVRADASGYTPAGDIDSKNFTYTWGNWNTWSSKVMRDSDTTLKITRNGDTLLIEASNVDFNESPNNMTATVKTTLTAADDCVFYLTCQNAWVDILQAKDVTVREGGITVGSTDRDTSFWTQFSNIFAIPEGQSVTKTFTNYTNGKENYMNFVAILQNTPTGHANIADNPNGVSPVEGYKEYVVLRPDNYGWGGSYEGCTVESDWNWDTFKSDMDGAKVTVTFTNNGTTADVTMLIVTADGSKAYHQSYKNIAIDGPLYACFTVEGSYIQFDTLVVGKQDMTTPFWSEHSDIYAVPKNTSKTIYFKNHSNGETNYNNFAVVLQNVPGAHSGAGIPVYMEYGVFRPDNWSWKGGDQDIFEKECDWNWDTFRKVMEDAYIELTVTNKDDKTAEIAITATSADGVQHHQYFHNIPIEEAGLYFCLTCEGSYLEIERERVGNTDKSTAWWSQFSNIWKVEAGTTLNKTFTNYTNGENVWNNYVAVLQKTPEGHSLLGADGAVKWPCEGYGEYVVLRADNYGWGDSYKDTVASRDFNGTDAEFCEAMEGASVLMQVKNNGTTVDFFITITTKAGAVLTQTYSSIPVDGDVYLSLLSDGGYLLVD